MSVESWKAAKSLPDFNLIIPFNYTSILRIASSAMYLGQCGTIAVDWRLHMMLACECHWSSPIAQPPAYRDCLPNQLPPYAAALRPYRLRPVMLHHHPSRQLG